MTGSTENTNIPADAESVEKRNTARLSVVSNISLLIMKLVVGTALGSIGILSEAIHSGMDLLAAVIAYFSVKISSEPADEFHEFGHGKFEDVSGLIEATLIFIAALIIIIEAVPKLILPTETETTSYLMIAGLAVMGISGIINWIVSSKLMKTAKATDSIALESDAWHLRTDVYTSVGVFIGLALMFITGIKQIDSIIALAVAVIIMHTSYDLAKRSAGNLIDRSIPEEDKEKIRVIICRHTSEYNGFHGVRTRRAGPNIFITIHLVVEGITTVDKSHALADEIERNLIEEYPRAIVTIHVEPCRHCEIPVRCGEYCGRHH